MTAETGEISPDQIKAAVKAMRQMGKALGKFVEQLPTMIRMAARTTLAGWPTSVLGWPTSDEIQRIRLIHDELSLHEPDLADERLWYLAGQCVARMRRDLPASGAA